MPIFYKDKEIKSLNFEKKDIGQVYYGDILVWQRQRERILKYLPLVKKVRFGTGINTKLLTDAVNPIYGGSFREIKFFETVSQSYLTLKDKSYNQSPALEPGLMEAPFVLVNRNKTKEYSGTIRIIQANNNPKYGYYTGAKGYNWSILISLDWETYSNNKNNVNGGWLGYNNTSGLNRVEVEFDSPVMIQKISYKPLGYQLNRDYVQFPIIEVYNEADLNNPFITTGQYVCKKAATKDFDYDQFKFELDLLNETTDVSSNITKWDQPVT